MSDEVNIINVRWWDGYLETFEATEVRSGCDLLWLRLVDGPERNIPLRHVRWWSGSRESHGTDTRAATQRDRESGAEQDESSLPASRSLPILGGETEEHAR